MFLLAVYILTQETNTRSFLVSETEPLIILVAFLNFLDFFAISHILNLGAETV